MNTTSTIRCNFHLRSPFEGSDEYIKMRNKLVGYGMQLIQAVQEEDVIKCQASIMQTVSHSQILFLPPLKDHYVIKNSPSFSALVLFALWNLFLHAKKTLFYP